METSFNTKALLFDKKEYLESKKKAVSVYETGYKAFNRFIKFKESGLSILSGRCGTGKTTFACNLITNLVNNTEKKKNLKILFLSGEMSKTEIIDKLIASVSNRTLTLDSLNEGADELPYKLDSTIELCCEFFESLYIYEGILTLEFIKQAIDVFVKDEIKLDFIFIDHLGLIKLETSSYTGQRHLELDEIVRTLKLKSTEYSLNIILLAQLLRSGMGQKPVLSSLKGSSSIEENADLVLGLYSDGFVDETPGVSKIDLLILKNRFGRISDDKGIPFKFSKTFGLFEEESIAC